MKLQRQRDELAAQETRLREGAAAELGRVMLDCGAEAIEPAQLRRLMMSVQAHGIEEAMKRMLRT